MKIVHRARCERRLRERMERMRQKGEHCVVAGRGGDKRWNCWCGMSHRQVLVTGDILAKGIVYSLRSLGNRYQR